MAQAAHETKDLLWPKRKCRNESNPDRFDLLLPLSAYQNRDEIYPYIATIVSTFAKLFMEAL
jgi:hypothetical protein